MSVLLFASTNQQLAEFLYSVALSNLSWVPLSENYCKQPRVCVLGDFNCPNVAWQDGLCLPSASPAEHRFLNCVLKLQLSQHVLEPTRFETGQRSSCLDLVLSSPAVYPITITLHKPLSCSYHATVYADIPATGYDHTQAARMPNYWKVDVDALQLKAATLNWTASDTLAVEEV